jgi:hypothetical protein
VRVWRTSRATAAEKAHAAARIARHLTRPDQGKHQTCERRIRRIPRHTTHGSATFLETRELFCEAGPDDVFVSTRSCWITFTRNLWLILIPTLAPWRIGIHAFSHEGPVWMPWANWHLDA